MTFVEKNLFNFTILMILKLTETKTQSTDEIFRNKQNGFGQISVSHTSTRLQLSAVIQTTRTVTTLCKTSGNLNFSCTLEMHKFLSKTYSL